MTDRKYVVSLTTPKGRVIKDLTGVLSSGEFVRERNNIGSLSGVLTNDESVFPILRKIRTWGTWVQVEEVFDGFEGSRELVFAGPITDCRPGFSGVELTGSDMSAYWSKLFVRKSNYRERDVAFLVEQFLTDNLAQNPNSVPVFRVFTSGYKDGVDPVEPDHTLISDVMSGFPGLSYVCVGRQLFLFGLETQPEAVLRFDDESWREFPVPEDSGAIYANGVLVVGANSRVRGYVELDNIDPDVGLLVRRFDLPDIRRSSVAMEAARVRLAQVSSSVMLGGQDLELVSHGDVSSNGFLPGCYVDVKSYVTGVERVQKLMLDRLSVDLVSGVRTVGLSPIDRLGVYDG